LNESFIEKAMKNFGIFVLRAASSITGSLSDAEDIFSDVFLALWQHDKIFDNEEHLKAWLIRVAINKAKNLKKQAFNRYRATMHDNIPYKDESTIKKEVNDALQQLKPNERAVVYLHYYEGYNFEEIGKILGIGKTSARVKAMRGRNKLKELLNEDI